MGWLYHSPQFKVMEIDANEKYPARCKLDLLNCLSFTMLMTIDITLNFKMKGCLYQRLFFNNYNTLYFAIRTSQQTPLK